MRHPIPTAGRREIGARAIQRRLGVLSIICLAGVGCSTTGNASVTFTDDGRLFSVELPRPPTRSEDTVPASLGEVLFVTYTAETKEALVIVSTTDFPKPLPEDAEGPPFLDAVAETSALALQGTIQSTTDITFSGHPGKDVVIARPVGTAFQRILIVGNRLYSLRATSDLGGRPPAYDRMLETFTLL